MSDIDGPVILTQSALDSFDAGNMIFYDDVPQKVVSRSGFLSSVSEAGGDARLPDFVAMSEFKAWSEAVTAGKDKESTYNTDMDIAQVCTVLKVADALDDACVNAWLKLAAGILCEDAPPRSRPATCDPQHISDCLSKLPHQLQHRVFETALTGGRKEYLSSLLDLLPSHHHAAVIAATVSPDKSLSTGLDWDTRPLTTSLKLLPASPPSLLSLSLHGYHHFSYTGPPPPVQEAAEGLADALRHHSGLASLRLDTFGDSVSMRALAPAVATLTALEALSLGSLRHVDVEAFPDLKVMIPPLQRLQHLTLTFCSPAASPPQKRSRELEEGDSPPEGEPRHRPSTSQVEPQHEVSLCLASLLSASTALKTLDITDAQGALRLAAEQPLRLPCLQHVKLVSSQWLACAIFNQLDAPVATVTLREHFLPSFGTNSFPRGPRDKPDAPRLWRALQRCKELKSLAIRNDFGAIAASVAVDRLPEPSFAEASLPNLREVNINEGLPAHLVFMEELAGSAAGVQRLRFYCGWGLQQDGAAALWQKLHLCFGRMRTLQHLCIGTGVLHAMPEGAGLAALRPLTQLTALHLQGRMSCLGSPEDCEALAGMRQLRSLCLDGFTVAPSVQHACVRALGALPSLAQAALCIDRHAHDVAASFQAAFVKHAPGAGWPALEWLALYVVAAEDGAAVARAVSAFPALKELRLQCYFFEDQVLRNPCKGAANEGLRVVKGIELERFEWDSELMPKD